MSSEISIDGAGRLKGPGTSARLTPEPRKGSEGRSATDEGFRPWHFFVLASILIATVAVILARQSSPTHLILLSLTIAAAGAAAGAFHRMLLPLMTPSAVQVLAPLNERTRAAVEREKALVLRSIKELEFDRAMGKLSQKDFDEMAGRLRARALSLMKQLEGDAASYSTLINRELQARLRAAEPKPHGDLPARASSPRCVCGTTNDRDAVFCKRCGTRLVA